VKLPVTRKSIVISIWLMKQSRELRIRWGIS